MLVLSMHHLPRCLLPLVLLFSAAPVGQQAVLVLLQRTQPLPVCTGGEGTVAWHGATIHVAVTVLRNLKGIPIS